MRTAVLGASGKVGRLLVAQAIERGHHVVALVRAPDRYADATAGVEVRRADVLKPDAFPDLGDVDAVVSAIGIGKGDGPGALIAGARALAEARVRTVWLGALGSGASTNAGGRLYQAIMRLAVGGELAEKAEADQVALRAGATVFHTPDLAGGPISATRRIVPLADLKRPLLPPRISRASLASLLLDEAETGRHTGGIVVPLR
jgi:uncharacterized protein YbjT (DUF2867 family)